MGEGSGFFHLLLITSQSLSDGTRLGENSYNDKYGKPATFSVALCPEEPRSWGRSEGAGMLLSSPHPWGRMQPPQPGRKQRDGISPCPTPRTSLRALRRLLHSVHMMWLQVPVRLASCGRAGSAAASAPRQPPMASGARWKPGSPADLGNVGWIPGALRTSTECPRLPGRYRPPGGHQNKT